MSSVPAAPALPQLKVSDNRRFLVTENGQPFFWLGDTAWELFHRLNRETAPAKVKNALLEAVPESQVTIVGGECVVA